MKVIMTAPTKPLVEQHHETLTKMLDISEIEIVVLDGSVPPNQRKDQWKSKSVFVCTPQTLRNDIISGHIDLSKVSFVCIDEAHRCVGEDATVLVAEQFRQQNPSGRLIGITASPGSKDKMEEIVQNLGAKKIEYMDEEDPKVKPYVYQTAEEYIKVDLPVTIQNIITQLQSVLDDFLKVLKELEVISSSQRSRNPRSALIGLPGQIQNQRSEFEDDSQFFAAMSAAGNALRASHALELIETQGIPALYKYLEEQLRKVKREGKTSIRKFLQMPQMQAVWEDTQDLFNQGEIHPKLDYLLQLVKHQLEEEVTSRILVFSNYRNTSKTLSEALNSLDAVSSQWFVGQASSRTDQGLKQREQIEILQQFKNGTLNVLVSTSVGEEGLDVAQCDLVIFYDVVPSATRLIQRSGRTGRARDGRVVILIAKGTRDEGYYWASQRRKDKLKDEILSVRDELETRNQTKVDDFFGSSEKQTSSPPSDQGDLKEKLQEKHGELPTIIVDHREKAGAVLRHLMNLEVNIEQQQLPVGDYILSDRVAVERKSVEDFTATVKRGDMFNQLVELKSTFTKPILLIEGQDVQGASLHKNSIFGILSSILLDLNIPIFYTKDSQETAEFIAYLAKKEQSEKKQKPVVKTSGSQSSMAEEQIALISQLPKINRVIAERLLDEFQTPRNFFSQTQDDLRKVRGVGKVLADRIDLLLSTPFKQSKEE